MAERLMINEQLRICDSKAEIPVAEESKRSRLRERDAATENKFSNMFYRSLESQSVRGTQIGS